jgi:hypothetical protein
MYIHVQLFSATSGTQSQCTAGDVRDSGSVLKV